jgi:hypothetical protein
MHWLSQNYQWLFDGIGGVVLIALVRIGYNRWRKSRTQADGSHPSSVLTAQGAKVTNSPVASGSNISQTINSSTLNLSLPAPASGAPGHERYREWREVIDEVHEALEQMGYAFVPIYVRKADDERGDYQAGIRRGNRVLHSQILIAESLEKSGLIKDWNELVQYTHAGRGPRDRWHQGSPTMGGFDAKARAFHEKLVQLAREDMNASQLQNRQREARLAQFLREGQDIQRKWEYSNLNAPYEKKEWENRVEAYLKEELDESYVVRFRCPTHQIVSFPEDIDPKMRGQWTETTAKMKMLNDFISELQSPR